MIGFGDGADQGLQKVVQLHVIVHQKKEMTFTFHFFIEIIFFPGGST